MTKDQGPTSDFAKKEAVNKTGVDMARHTVKTEQPQEIENGDLDLDFGNDELTAEEMAKIDAMKTDLTDA